MKKENEETEEKNKKLIAKRDFTLHHNDVHHDIKKGDNVLKLKLDEAFLVNLKTEKVI